MFLGLNTAFAADESNFEGLEKAMNTATYEKAGLQKLTTGERAVLNDFIRDYVSGKQKAAAEQAASQAVDRAVKERKVRPPEIIQARLVGTYNGYSPRTFFHLDNGQVWKPTNDDVYANSPIESPAVLIFRDTFGYKMYVEGASIVRVKRIK